MLSATWGHSLYFSIGVPVSRPAYDNPGRAQQAIVQGIAFLDHRQDGIGCTIAAFLDRHGLMPGRVEGLTGRVDDLDARLFEGTVQLLQGRLRALEEGRTWVHRRGIDAGLERIPYADQFLREAFDRKFAGIPQLTLGAPAVIVEIRHGAQIVVPV